MRKKLLLLLTAIVFSLSASGQIKKHPQLQKENVDFKSITDSNYALYKLVTTVPLSPLREIDPKYVLKDFNWDNLLKTNSAASLKLGALLNDSLTMREPLSGENLNFIYLTASIPINLLPLMMTTKHSEKMEPEGKSYLTRGVKNLYDLDLRFVPNLVDGNRRPIRLGQICEVTTSHNLETENMDFTIALELLDARFTDISSGNIETTIGGFRGVEKMVIKKLDVGKEIRFCSSIYNVLAFEDGVLHLRYDQNSEKFIDMFRNDFRFIGNIGGNKFHIKCNYQSLIYAAYVRYRDKPKLSPKKFQKYINPTKKINVDMYDMKYGVMVYHFGFDMDSLNLYIPNKLLPANFTGAISVKKSGEDYAFRTIYKRKNMMEDNLTMKSIERVREYFRQNVHYPDIARDNGIQGDVRFSFVLSPDGVISDLVILSSPDESLSNEVRRIAKKVPRFKSELTEKMKSSMILRFQL